MGRRDWLRLCAGLGLGSGLARGIDFGRFTGEWKLNEGKSDDLGARMREAGGRGGGGRGGGPPGGGMPGGGMPGGGMPGGGGWPGGGGGGGRRGGPGGGPGGDSGSGSWQGPDSFHDLMNQASRSKALTINEDGPEFNITTDEGRILTLKTDGTTDEAEDMRGRKVKVKTVYEGGALVSTRKYEGGGELKTTYALEEGGKQLVVSHELKPPAARKAIVVRYVYDSNRK